MFDSDKLKGIYISINLDKVITGGEGQMNKRITSDPQICGGEPCISETRIPVHVILSHFAAGDDHDTILKQFPRISKEDILACLEFASYLATEKAVA